MRTKIYYLAALLIVTVFAAVYFSIRMIQIIKLYARVVIRLLHDGFRLDSNLAWFHPGE
jgi:hypothetical protein